MISNFHGEEGSNMARSWSKERIINAIWLLVSLCFCYAAILSYYQEQEVMKYLAGSFWDVQRGTGLLIVLGVAILFTLVLYLVLEFTSSTYLRDNRRNILLFVFYFIGLVTDIGLIVAVVLGTVDLHSMWEKFIMFKYSVDPFMFITFWSSLPEKWRVFYSRHHSASMIIVGVWFSLHSDFTTTMLKAAVIWLTADLLGNIASMHRIIYSSRLAKKKVLDILIVIFIFQRIQRVSSLIYVGLFECNRTLFLKKPSLLGNTRVIRQKQMAREPKTTIQMKMLHNWMIRLCKVSINDIIPHFWYRIGKISQHESRVQGCQIHLGAIAAWCP